MPALPRPRLAPPALEPPALEPPSLAQLRFQTQRGLQDAGLRLAVLASEASDRLWAWKNAVADRMVMACGFGGPLTLLDIPEYPVTIFARAGGEAERLELWQWDPEQGGDGYDRAQYTALEQLPAAPMFGPGGLQMFMTQDRAGAKRYFVRAYDADGSTRDSDLIFSKIEESPTQRRDGALRISAGEGPPQFAWPRFDQPGLWISFLMVLEGPERTLRTGVYSWETRWRFPEVRQVPFFYHAADPTPRLTPGQQYEAIYVAVDSDRWIRYADSLRFTAR